MMTLLKNEPMKTMKGLLEAVEFCKEMNYSDDEWTWCFEQIKDTEYYNFYAFDEDGYKLGYL